MKSGLFSTIIEVVGSVWSFPFIRSWFISSGGVGFGWLKGPERLVEDWLKVGWRPLQRLRFPFALCSLSLSLCSPFICLWYLQFTSSCLSFCHWLFLTHWFKCKCKRGPAKHLKLLFQKCKSIRSETIPFQECWSNFFPECQRQKKCFFLQRW